MKPSRLLGNLRLASATVLDHAGEDPFVLAMQVSRRLPRWAAGPAARGLVALPGGGVLPPLGQYMLGNHNATISGLHRCLSARSPRTRLRAADVALAAQQPALADQLLATVGAGTRGRPSVQARRRWYAGAMTDAVRSLDSVKGAGRQQQRLASELEVFSGFRPQLPATAGYVPQPGVVLHLLTNSLPHTQSGYAQRSHSFLRAQSEDGFSVHAVTRIGYPVQVGRLGARDTDVVDGVTYHRLLPSTLPKGMAARLQKQAEEVLVLARRLRPEVIHTTTHFVNGLVAREVAASLGIPWVYEVRGQLADTWAASRPEEARASERYRLFRRREAEVAADADLVVTLGEAMRNEVLGTDLPPRKVMLLPNAVGEAFLDEPMASSDARATLGLVREGLVVGTVSSLVDYEGLDDLLRAIALLAPEYPSLRGLIVGDGASAPGLKALAADLGIADRVSFPGRVPRDLAPLYHQALDVFVVPRKDLPVTRTVTPLKPVEALASGRPVIASDLPALREIVAEGTTGAFFRPGDPGSLAGMLGSLLDDRNRREKLGRAGRRYVLAERTWASNARAAAVEYAGLRK